MLEKLPINKSQRSQTLVILFIFVVLVAVSYFLVKLTYIGGNSDIDQSTIEQTSAAYFVPPESTVQEVSVTGRVAKVLEGEKDLATHKILDANNNLLVYARTADDKLMQQEGSVVTLVGNIPITKKMGPDVVMDVLYISFK